MEQAQMVPTEADLEDLVAEYRQTPNWVLNSSMHPTTQMDDIIHPLADAVRSIYTAQDELGAVMFANEERQKEILKRLEALELGGTNTVKEDPTLKVLKASVKLVQDQQDEMKKQLADLKRKEPGEVTDTSSDGAKDKDEDISMDTDISKAPTGPGRPRIGHRSSREGESGRNGHRPDKRGDHNSPIRRQIRDLGREFSPDRRRSSTTDRDIEREFVDRELSSLTRRLQTAFRDIDESKEKSDNLEGTFRKEKEGLETELLKLAQRVGNLEQIFIDEMNDQRLATTRVRTWVYSPIESLKLQVGEMWKHLLQQEGRDTGEMPRTAERRQAQSLASDANVLYWRDKIINASQSSNDIDVRFNSFKMVGHAIQQLNRFDCRYADPIEHVPNDKGKAFLQRCMGWWESCYNDSKLLRMRFPQSGTKRRSMDGDAECAPEPDSKRILTAPRVIKGYTSSFGKDLLGSFRGRISSPNGHDKGVPTGPNRDRLGNDSHHTDSRSGWKDRPTFPEFRADRFRSEDLAGRLTRSNFSSPEGDYHKRSRFYDEPKRLK